MRQAMLLLLAAGLSSASILVQRSTIAQVMQDVADVDKHVLMLTGQIRGYEGGLPAMLPQLETLSSVYDALQAGVRDSGDLPKFITLVEAFNLVVQVNETLAIDNPAAIDALIAKKPLYEDAGAAATIAPVLQVLLDGHEQCSQNILDRVPPETPQEAVDLGKQVIEVISAALRKGIAAFTQDQACS